MSVPSPADAPPVRLTFTHWLILVIASIGFAFDTLVLLVMPLIGRPALAELIPVDRYTASGTREILHWFAAIMWGSAICGGTFGMLGGYLTDWLGRRRILTWSIILYSVSALASGFATTAPMLMFFRCTTFIGVCVEFVAAVAWLAELFPNPRQREAVLGYTQAFSSIGGLLVTGAFWVTNHYAEYFPAIYGAHAAWRYTLIAGVLPALPLLVIRPFLPESPAWQHKRAQGLLKRPPVSMLFQRAYLRTTLVTAALFACGFGAAFGTIQFTPQIVPGLFAKELGPLTGKREAYEIGKSNDPADPEKNAKLDALAKQLEGFRAAAQEAEASEPGAPKTQKAQTLVKRTEGILAAARKAAEGERKGEHTALIQLEEDIKKLEEKQEEEVANVQFCQEIGGLVGRFALATLALVIVGRRLLLWLFQVPGLILIPLVYYFPGAGNLASDNLFWLKVGLFIAGFFTIAQFSFWGNYLPRVYPTFLRGTGESFAANVGGRMFGTGFNAVTTYLFFPLFVSLYPTMLRPGLISYAAATTAVLVYGVGVVLTFFLPEPKPGGEAE